MMKNTIKDKSALLSHIRFSTRMKYLSLRAIQTFKKRFDKKVEPTLIDDAFILDSLLELCMRSREGVLIQYSDGELNNIFNGSIQALYNSQNKIVKQEGLLESFGI